MIGGLLVVVLGVLDQQEAFAAVDLSVIFLLAGMMVIASILARTGFFELVAIRSVRLSQGHPIRLLLILATVTAVLSAFLDNVTTVVLMTPITLSVARRLDISPMPYLISGILASNIGGTATLIGDPPNIMIGVGGRPRLQRLPVQPRPGHGPRLPRLPGDRLVLVPGPPPGTRRATEAALEEKEEGAIKDRPLLVRSLAVTAATIVGLPLPLGRWESSPRPSPCSGPWC